MQANCPTPQRNYPQVVMGHGAGGSLARELIEQVICPAFDNPTLARLEDQAVLASEPGRPAITTDSFVIDPRFFPGGDIGSLSIYGTVNDLAVGGATPRYITAALILEEGLTIEELKQILTNMRRACDRCGVTLVAGDTKVVQRGRGDGIYITTTGLGWVAASVNLGAHQVRVGDRVIVSGTLGDHGITILSQREGLRFDAPVVSDCAPLHQLTRRLIEALGEHLRCMRDATRGGVSAVLHEIATAAKIGMKLDERTLPVKDAVRGACELLGLDPLYVANEGKLIAIVAPAVTEQAIDLLRSHPLGADAAVIAEVIDGRPGMLTMRSLVGGERLVPQIAAEQLPRIC